MPCTQTLMLKRTLASRPIAHCAHILLALADCRYGLRHLADANLMDLIASVRCHLKTSARVGWFAQFTGRQGGACSAASVCGLHAALLPWASRVLLSTASSLATLRHECLCFGLPRPHLDAYRTTALIHTP